MTGADLDAIRRIVREEIERRFPEPWSGWEPVVTSPRSAPSISEDDMAMAAMKGER